MARVSASIVGQYILDASLAEKELQKFTKAMQRASKEVESSFSLMSAASLAAKASIVAAVTTIIPAIAGLGLQALKLEPAREAFENYAERAGFAADELLAKYRAAAQGMLTDAELIRKANMAFMFVGESIAEDLIPVLEFVSKASLATGESMDFLFASMVKGVGRASTKLLDNAMLVARLTDIYKDYAAQVNKAVDELTGQERVQAVANYVTEKGSELAFELASKSGDLVAQISALRVGFVNLGYEIGRAVIPLFEALIPRISDAASSLRDYLIPELHAAATALRDLLGISADINISFKMDKARGEIKGLEDELRELGDYVFLESEAFEKYAAEKVKVERKYAKRIAEAQSSYGTQRLRRVEDFGRREQQIREEGTEDLFKIDESVTQDLADLWDDYQRQQASAQAEFNARMRRESRDFLISIQRMNEDHRMEMGELTRAFRGADTKEERDRIRERMRQTRDEHWLRRRRASQDNKTDRDDAKKAFNRERSQRQKEAQARANQLAREAKERREIRRQETIDRLADLVEEQKRVLARMDADHGVRIAKLQQQEQEALQPLKDKLAEKSALEEQAHKDTVARLEKEIKTLEGLLIRYEQTMRGIVDASAPPEETHWLVKIHNFFKYDFLPVLETVRDHLAELAPIAEEGGKVVEKSFGWVRRFDAYMTRKFGEGWKDAKGDIAAVAIELWLASKAIKIIRAVKAITWDKLLGGREAKAAAEGASEAGATVAKSASLLERLFSRLSEVGRNFWGTYLIIPKWMAEWETRWEKQFKGDPPIVGYLEDVQDAFEEAEEGADETQARYEGFVGALGALGATIAAHFVRPVETATSTLDKLGGILEGLPLPDTFAYPPGFLDSITEDIDDLRMSVEDASDPLMELSEMPDLQPNIQWKNASAVESIVADTKFMVDTFTSPLPALTFKTKRAGEWDKIMKQGWGGDIQREGQKLFRPGIFTMWRWLYEHPKITLTLERAGDGWEGGGYPGGATHPQNPPNVKEVNVNFNAPVYGERDFESKVKDAARAVRDEDVSQARTYDVAGR